MVVVLVDVEVVVEVVDVLVVAIGSWGASVIGRVAESCPEQPTRMPIPTTTKTKYTWHFWTLFTEARLRS